MKTWKFGDPAQNVATAIRAWVTAMDNSEGSPKAVALELVRGLDPHACAMITWRECSTGWHRGK